MKNKCLQNFFKIMEFLAYDKNFEPATVGEIAARCNISKSTVSDILADMVASEYLEKPEKLDLYKFTVKFPRMGILYKQHLLGEGSKIKEQLSALEQA